MYRVITETANGKLITNLLTGPQRDKFVADAEAAGYTVKEPDWWGSVHYTKAEDALRDLKEFGAPTA